ncbi:MAG: pyruvate kinase [Planctomycetes bacterium]|nr:pyruvate kinase [Planctomycetota bacterium]
MPSKKTETKVARARKKSPSATAKPTPSPVAAKPPRARTRILATLGPASDSEEMIEKLIRAGANAFRLNFSHGTHDEHRERVARVRRVASRLGMPVSLLQDLQGPKIRTGPLKDRKPILLEVGRRVRMTHRVSHTQPGIVATNYRHLVDDVKVGDRLLLDDGALELRCVEKGADELICEVVCGGILRGKKGINLPGVNVSTPSLTRKDRADLKLGIELGVDWIALSFVRRAEDVRKLRALIKKQGARIAIVAKIEKPEAVKDLSAILDAAEGIMVARGDLGVETPAEELPVLQKSIIAAARRRGRVVITATQMLESMVENPRPTRAEASDVANAILDGTDVVMLSAETAVGKNPVTVVEMMRAIIIHTESSDLYERIMGAMPLDPGRDVADATVHAAAAAARELKANCLFAFSSSGRTCFKLSFARPHTPIVGATFTEEAFNRMALCWGIEVVLLKKADSVDELYFLGERELLDGGRARLGDLSIVITGSNVSTGGGTNTLKIHRVGDIDMTDDPDATARFSRLYKRHGAPATRARRR